MFQSVNWFFFKFLGKAIGLLEVLKPFCTSHLAYVATETELDGAKIDGLLPPNFL